MQKFMKKKRRYYMQFYEEGKSRGFTHDFSFTSDYYGEHLLAVLNDAKTSIHVKIDYSIVKSEVYAPSKPQPPPKQQQDADETQFWVCPNCGNNTQMKDQRQYCSSCKIYLSI